MLKKLGLTLLSLSLLSTGCAQAFSLSSVTQKVPVSKKHVLYAAGALTLLKAILLARSSKYGYYSYALMEKNIRQSKDIKLTPAGRIHYARVLKEARRDAIISVIYALGGSAMLYKAYTSK